MFCGIMEKVWEELKRIEAQAELIRSEAQEKGKKINILAKQKAEELVTNGKIYAQEEAGKVVNGAVQEANVERDARLKANIKEAETLRLQAEKRMDQAAEKVLATVLGE